MKEIIKQGYQCLVAIGAEPYGPEAIEFAKIRCLKHLQELME